MKHLFLLTAILLSAPSLLANNIRISNLEISAHDLANDTYTLQFDLAWDNSWRTSTFESNWDAAWVFVKFTRQNQQTWGHAELLVTGPDPAADGHVVPAGAEIAISSDQVGCFIQRSSDGSGDLNYTSVQLVWDYSGEFIDDNDLVDVSVQAIEMVYVPEGAFYLGDGSGDNYSFQDGLSSAPVLMDDEFQILQLGGSAGLSNGAPSSASDAPNGDDFNDSTTRILPAEWPMGVHGYYVMKYEVSRMQYAQFLGMLTSDQRDNLIPECDVTTGYSQFDNLPDFTNEPIMFAGDFYATPNYPYYPVNCVSWEQIMSYLDWSGLRPLSETEFEKACRGPLYPVQGEYAWGNTNAYLPIELQLGPHVPYEIENLAEANETVSEGLSQTSGNAFIPKQGVFLRDGCPLCQKPGFGRVGSIAASMTNPTRTNTGASYYGIMEMSGNALESIILLGNSNTRDFTGMHGDGQIGYFGAPSSELLGDWSNNTAVGVGFRELLVSNRTNLVDWPKNLANIQELIPVRTGIRGCRTAGS